MHQLLRLHHALPLLLVTALLACRGTRQAESSALPFRPNIVWLVAEDMSPYLSMFGDSTVETPHLSWLAAQGVRYPNTFSVSGVCAPSRAAIATGMYPSSIGAHHMRTQYVKAHMDYLGLPLYEAVPPPEVKMMSQLLRENGYYCTNNSKTDYQFAPPVTAWDASSDQAHWRGRPAGKPFFSIFNFDVTHESQVFGPTALRNLRYQSGFPDAPPAPAGQRLDSADWKLHVPADLDVPIPPYLPATEAVRGDVRRVYSNIIELDRMVGFVLDQLRADGLLDSTIIFFYSDHGGPLPRQKRLLYDSGLRVPLIVRFPDGRRAGNIDSLMVSFVDLAPTVFSLAGIRPPDYLQGQAFLGPYRAKTDRRYIHAAADRFDTEYDRIRAVRDKRYKYLRNYNTDRPYYLPVAYREQMASMQELLRLRDAGQLNAYQAQWFRATKPPEELFDTHTDPHELHNLAADPAHAETLARLRTECAHWLREVGDLGHIPEKELIRQMWGSLEQPTTAAPIIERTANGLIQLQSATPGAHIGYQIIRDGKTPASWAVYTRPFALPAGARLRAVAHRLGYQASEVVE